MFLIYICKYLAPKKLINPHFVDLIFVSEFIIQTKFNNSIAGTLKNFREDLDKGTKVILFFFASSEAAVKYGDFDAMKYALPYLSKTIIIHGCGHYIQQERTEEANAELIKFLNKEILQK